MIYFTDEDMDKEFDDKMIDIITKDTGISKQVLQNDNQIHKSAFDKYDHDLIYNSIIETIEVNKDT